VEESWTRLLAGRSGARTIQAFDASHLATDYACEVRRGDGSDGSFDADRYMEPKDQRKVDDFILYGIAAAQQAVEDSGWVPQTEEDRHRTGVMIGSGIGGLKSIEETTLLISDKGARRVSPFFIPGSLINLISGQVSSATASRARTIPSSPPAPRRPRAGRRRAPHQVRQRRRDGRRRGRGRDLRDRHRRLQRLQGPLDQAQGRPDQGQPPL
jgi:3-oxoacyl-(acyl-carrier-protein) synthase